MQGGAETGFKHVLPEEYRPRLLHFSGKRKIEVKEVSQMQKKTEIYTIIGQREITPRRYMCFFPISLYQIILTMHNIKQREITPRSYFGIFEFLSIKLFCL